MKAESIVSFLSRKGKAIRGSNIFWILLITPCLLGLVGSGPSLMAYDGDDGGRGGGHGGGQGRGQGRGQSHNTHTQVNPRGPGPLACETCHVDKHYKLDQMITEGVCDTCHSPGGSFDGVRNADIGAAANWFSGVYESDGNSLQAGKEKWCAGCHDDEPGNSKADDSGVDAPNVIGDHDTYGFYVSGSGHGRSARIECLGCHDATFDHIDGKTRTYEFNEEDLDGDGLSDIYEPGNSGVAYQEGYRLRYVGGDVPFMIPACYCLTFDHSVQSIEDKAFRLCFDCHDSSKIFDDTVGNGIDTNFKASLPNPPRDYSYAHGYGADTNEHVAHILNFVGSYWDSDWDNNTTGQWVWWEAGCDSLMTCPTCHNVHGAAGTQGSTNEAMIRDGSLAGRSGYGFSYVIEDTGIGGYPMVTSNGATQSTSVGAIFRSDVASMCGSSICHGHPDPPPESGYDATGSGYGTYLEYYRPWEDLSE
jgi:hypothetical protein